MVEKSDYPNYFYVKKNSDIIYSPYDKQQLDAKNIMMQHLDPLFKQMFENHGIQKRDGYYITNIVTGECLSCFDFIWNRSFHDVCKHCHSARIFVKSLENYDAVVNETKEQLVIYFKNKQRILPPEIKNYIIYQGDIESAFREIVKEYNEKGKYKYI